MSRRLVIGIVLVACLVGAGYAGYVYYLRGSPPPESPVFVDTGDQLPTQAEFDTLAERDPVKMLAVCLTRYQREVTHGLRCTIEKQERVKGSPKHPEMPVLEVIDVCVRGDVPDPETEKTAIEVVMKWKEGAKTVGFAEIRGTLFSEKPGAEHEGKILSWRPDAWRIKIGPPIAANTTEAKGQSRYCIRDAGIYRSMLRTHKAWKERQDASEFNYEYLGKRVVEKTGNRECHAIKRICPRVELDAFELGGTASTDPKTVAVEGFTEVTLYVDAERWVQVGTELYRTEPDGTRVLIGAYYFRDVNLKPTLPPETFTVEGLKK